MTKDRWHSHLAPWIARVAMASLLTALILATSVPARAQGPDPSLAPPDSSDSAPDADTTSVDPPFPAPDPRAAVPVPNERPTTQLGVRLKGDHNVIRTGPGNGYAIAGVYPEGTTFPVIAKSGRWYNVRLSDSQTGWIHASLCKEFQDLSDLEFRPNPKLFTRTGSYMLTGYAGAYAFDRKSNSLAIGGRLGYYLFDRFLFEAGVGWTHVKRPAEIVESLFGLSLEAEDFQMLFYHLDLTWEVLPGRQMVPYVSGGAGSSIMLGESEPGFNVGAGTTLFLSKRTAMRWEFRDYWFRSGSQGARTNNNNVEFTLGTAVLF
jgi:outer membrane beta-barrel protein